MDPVARIEGVLVELLGPSVRRYIPSTPSTHPAIFVSQLFESIRSAIASGDKSAVSLACDLIARDPMTLPFGKLVKSDLARELRRTSEALLASERTQLIAATVRLLGLPYAPRELEDYAKLVRKLPREEYMPGVSAVVTQNEKAARIKAYLLAQ